MVPFGIRILWFILSFVGLLVCWVVFFALGKALGTMWAPLAYLAACSTMQLAFLLGIIWRMDTYAMPKAFCVVQTTLFTLSDFVMTGVAVTFTCATAICVIKPKTWAESQTNTFVWRRFYFIPVVVAPVLLTAVQTALYIHFDAVQPSNEIHCDANDPIWVRFFGYAGVPLLACFPCLILTIVSIRRVWRTNEHIQRSWQNEFLNEDHFTSQDTRRRSRSKLRRLTAHIKHKSLTSPSGDSSPNSTPGGVSTAHSFHVQPTLELPLDTASSDAHDTTECGPDSPTSESFPTFAHPRSRSRARSSDSEIRTLETQVSATDASSLDIRSSIMRTNSDKTLQWERRMGMDEDTKHSTEDFDEDTLAYDAPHAEGHQLQAFTRSPFGRLSHKSRRPPPASLAPIIMRCLVFQLLFCAVHVLASISTIVDVARQRSPTCFGTTEVAMIMAGWAPAILFGTMPGVFEHIRLPWKRPAS